MRSQVQVLYRPFKSHCAAVVFAHVTGGKIHYHDLNGCGEMLNLGVHDGHVADAKLGRFAKNRAPSFKMPKIYRPRNEKVFRAKIGFWNKNGKRVRREFRLGDDPLLAHKKALALAEAWLREKKRHRRGVPVDREMFPDDPPSLPIWTGRPEVEDEMRREDLATPPEDLPDDHEDAPALLRQPGVTIEQHKEDFLKRLRGKTVRDQKAPRTYGWFEEQFRLGFVPDAVEVGMEAIHLQLPQVEAYCHFWVDLKQRAADIAPKTFGWRTASNRIDALNALIASAARPPANHTLQRTGRASRSL